jgi:hypothetical protein
MQGLVTSQNLDSKALQASLVSCRNTALKTCTNTTLEAVQAVIGAADLAILYNTE